MNTSEPRLARFTFGVEIEFILACRLPDIDDDDDFDEEVEDHMRDIFIREPLMLAGLQVYGYEIDGIEYHYGSDNPDHYEKWYVKEDNNVKATQDDFDRINGILANGVKVASFHDMSYVDVEVISPVMTFSAKAMQEVQTAVETICKQAVFVPRSAGLHVHIGNGDAYFPLSLFKNLAVLTSCFEEQWNQAVPPYRVDNPHYLLSSHSFFAKNRRCHAMAQAIYDLPDIHTLVRKFHVAPALFANKDPFYQYGTRNKAVTYVNQSPWTGCLEKKTVEFRQQAGSLDAFAILCWIVTVGTMAGIANEHPPDVFWEVIRKHDGPDGEEDWTFSLLELFKNFDVGRLGKLWEQNGLFAHGKSSPRAIPARMPVPSSSTAVQKGTWPKYLVILDE